MTRTFKAWFAGLVVTAAVLSVSVHWLDRPIALWVYGVFGEQGIPTEVPDRIFSIPLLSAIVFGICGLVAIMGRRFSKLESAVAMCSISALATTIIKDQLKFAFGRTWPNSFLHDYAYGFHFFQSGKSFESFPSGHAAVAAAVLSVVWILLPKCRVISVIGVVAVDIGLVALNLHFLSDVVAGTFLGASTGLFTVALWKAMGMKEDKLAFVPVSVRTPATKPPIAMTAGKVARGYTEPQTTNGGARAVSVGRRAEGHASR